MQKNGRKKRCETWHVRRAQPTNVSSSTPRRKLTPLAAHLLLTTCRVLLKIPNGHPRSPPPSHLLSLRSPDPPWPADRAAPSGPPLSHSRPELLAEGRARRLLHQLAAGSAGQLSRATRFS